MVLENDNYWQIAFNSKKGLCSFGAADTFRAAALINYKFGLIE
jgi:hypothetical protein